MVPSFEELGLSEETLKVLARKGFEEPSPIQAKTIPAVLTGTQDIIGQAQTGTGKTAAFGLPMIELLAEKARHVQALVLAPTRELAIQVAEEIHSLKGKRQLNIIPIYGGQSIGLQLQHLRRGANIVVGTPGRVLDHLRRKSLKLDKIEFMVLDEADEMLNMGFLEDVKSIMDQTNDTKRIMLFSATMPKEILAIAKTYMGDYQIVKVTEGALTVSQTDQIYFEVRHSDKFEALCRIIDVEEGFYGLVFCRTKNDVDEISNHLVERGYDADGLHGDKTQPLREKILNRFKKKVVTILVATDVAARGIDVNDLTHVINYALPQDPEAYVHRIGRTGRAGKEGNAITFVTPSEYSKLMTIRKRAKTDIRKGTLPQVKDVIRMKRAKIKNDVESILADRPQHSYFNLAKELLDLADPTEALAALLQTAYGDELDESKYVEIDQRRFVDKRGKTRLFVTQGKNSGMDVNKLITLIKSLSDLESHQIKDIEIHDKFSFVTLPFHEAETVLSHFKGRRRVKGAFVTKAKEDGRRSKESGRRSRDGDGRSREGDRHSNKRAPGKKQEKRGRMG
ncbi:DEAD/DEAH box helicase [bacterium]|nr:DEAD/DEAH box helicase [bacterium]